MRNALTPFEQKMEREKMLQFYISAVKFLQKKLPFDNMLLAAASCLHPNKKKDKIGIKQLEYLAKKFGHVIAEKDVSRLKDEWKLYQADENIELMKCRIDHYWRKVFKLKTLAGDFRYPTLWKLVKSILTLHHGNADVERSLSDNKNTCTKDRVLLKDETLIGLRRMKEYARCAGGAHNAVVTPEMLAGMKLAKKKNDERIQEEKKEKEIAAKKLEEAALLEKQKELMIENAGKSKISLEEKEREYLEEEGKLNDEFMLSKRMLDDANVSIKIAIEKCDMLGVRVASELISSAQEKMKNVEDLREKQKKDQEVLGKKRKLTIDSMFTKMKESCASKSLSKVRKVDDMLQRNIVNDGIENAVTTSSSTIPGSSNVKDMKIKCDNPITDLQKHNDLVKVKQRKKDIASKLDASKKLKSVAKKMQKTIESCGKSTSKSTKGKIKKSKNEKKMTKKGLSGKGNIFRTEREKLEVDSENENEKEALKLELRKKYAFDDNSSDECDIDLSGLSDKQPDEEPQQPQTSQELEQQPQLLGEQPPLQQPHKEDQDQPQLQKEQEQETNPTGGLDSIHFNIADAGNNIVPSGQDYIRITRMEDLEEDMWVLVDYKGDIYVGVILKLFPSIGKAKVKCLEKPFGVKCDQRFENVKFWDKYPLEKLFFCPVTPLQVADGSDLWKY